MISKLCDFFPFSHRKCRLQLSSISGMRIDDQLRIKSLNMQITSLVNQIQELKAVHDYQTAQLENNIVELEKHIAAAHNKIEKTIALDGSEVEIIDHTKKGE